MTFVESQFIRTTSNAPGADWLACQKHCDWFVADLHIVIISVDILITVKRRYVVQLVAVTLSDVAVPVTLVAVVCVSCVY